MSAPPTTLEPALAALPAEHRRIVTETVGAPGDQPAAIAAAISDEARLEALVRQLPDEARAATTELAFAAVELWSPPATRPASRAALDALERCGLALCFESRWSLAYMAPLDLVPALRRVRIRAHARRVPDAPAPARSLAGSEQLLHDAAAIGATIAHGGIQIKADGDLYAKARPKLAGALPPPPEPELDLGEGRVDLALTLLRELGALRVVSDDLPGRNARRELQLDGELPALLDRPFEERVRMTHALRRTSPDLQLIDPLLDELAGRTVALEALGVALIALFAEARKHLQIGSTTTTPLGVGLAAAHLRSLCGGAVIGVDADGHLATVTVAPQPPPEAGGPPCVAQADFELVALRPPLPHERAALLLLCEPVPGREHVARVTRERIHSAVRALRDRDPEAILGRLRALAGTLPQNVERSVADWVRQAPPRARLRSAIVVDAGDSDLGDRLVGELGALVAERLAPDLLAVPADELAAVASALRRAGVELEPGLDRVSGGWDEPPGGQDRCDGWWRPTLGGGERTALPPGRLVSGLDQTPALPASELDAARHTLERLELELDLGDEPDEYEQLEPGELLLESYETGSLVELRYAAANGTVVEHVTVEELDGARILVADPDTGAERWRWLKGVLDARVIED